MGRTSMMIKRLFDIVLSMFFLTLFLPLMIFCSILIVIESSGHPVFMQERVGYRRRVFNLYKLRSMKVDRSAEKSMDFSKDSDRLTKTGRVMRRAKIDELPQLLNVLKGDMSLVGPRPTVSSQVREYSSYQLKRLNMRPGMTGLAQINGNIALPWDKRIEYDVYYVDHWSLKLDLYIVLRTILIVILGEDKFVRISTHHNTSINE